MSVAALGNAVGYVFAPRWTHRRFRIASPESARSRSSTLFSKPWTKLNLAACRLAGASSFVETAVVAAVAIKVTIRPTAGWRIQTKPPLPPNDFRTVLHQQTKMIGPGALPT